MHRTRAHHRANDPRRCDFKENPMPTPPTDPKNPRPTRQALRRGDTLDADGMDTRLWRLRSGLLLVERSQTHAPGGLHLALPGDWIALDGLGGLPADLRLTALVPSQIVPVTDLPDTPSVEQWQQALRQTQRAADHLVALRTGAVESRLTHLLKLLRLAHRSTRSRVAEPGWPALRHLALLIDAAPETVCRVLARLRPAPAETRLALA
jgi:CRP-like cAMP-binding protein